MKLRLAVLLLSVCGIVAAEGQYTAAERKELDSFLTTIETGCRDMMAKMAARIPADAPPLARMMSELTQSSDYCGCTVQRIDDKLTPSLMRHGSEPEIQTLIKLSGTECVLPIFKSKFGSFCMDLLNEIQKGASEETSPGPEMCTCIQAEVDSITVEGYESYVQRSIQDYKEYQRSRVIPTTGPSLVERMFSCGLGKVKKKR